MFLFCCSGVMSERYQKRKTALLMIHRCFTLMDSIITLWSTLYKMLRFFYQLPTNSWTFSQLSKLLIGSVDEYCLDDVCFLPTVLETAKRKKQIMKTMTACGPKTIVRWRGNACLSLHTSDDEVTLDHRVKWSFPVFKLGLILSILTEKNMQIFVYFH